MLTWSAKRRIMFLLVAWLIFGSALAVLLFAVFYSRPTCSDGVQNQKELGVDCGGPCSRVCKEGTRSPVVEWARVFKVKDGLYSVMAYVENPNSNAVAYDVPYHFKIYDADNLLVYEIRGKTFIPDRQVFGVFEGALPTGSRVPEKVFFEFTGDPNWERTFADVGSVSVGEISVLNESFEPRLEAEILNSAIIPVTGIEVVAVVYDEAGNAMASSKTVVETIAPSGKEKAVFTWPEPFESKVGRLEVLFKVFGK